MNSITKQIDPRENALMSGIFNYYRNKSSPSDFIKNNYLKVNYSTGDINPLPAFGPGNTEGTFMFASDSVIGSWIEIKMKYPVYITHYSVYQCIFPHDNRFRKWKLDGSNDGKIWFSLDDYSNNQNTTMQQTDVAYLYTVQKPAKYEYIKLIMYRTSRPDGNIYHLVFSGFEIFGTIDYKTCLVTMKRSSCNIFSLLLVLFYLS